MRSLAGRISLLAVAVAVITALLAGVLAVNLVQRSNADTARSTLRQLADVAQTTANAGANATAAQTRARDQLRVLKIASAAISTSGRVSSASPLLRAVLTSQDVASVLAGKSVSAQRRVNGQRVLLEARPTNAGGIVLAQRSADATAVGDRAVRRIVWALLIAVGIAIVLGLLVAVRISRPLRRTAQAAHALGAGHRDVAVEPEHQRQDFGRAIMAAAEDWLRSQGVEKVMLMVRPDNTAVKAFYDRLGYATQERVLYAKWLDGRAMTP